MMPLGLSMYVASTTVYLIFLLTVMITQAFEHKEPFGMKMCQQLCVQISGCSLYTFNTSHLSCQVMMGANAAELQSGEVFHVGSTQGSDAMCPVKSRVLYIRGDNRCLKFMNIVSEDSQNARPIGRLLVAPNQLQEGSHFYQLFLRNNSLGKYPFFYSVNVCSIAYVFKSNTLVVALTKPNKIIAMPLDTIENTTIARALHVRSMAVDENRELLIVGDVSNSNIYTLVGIKINGGGIRHFKHLKGPTFSAGSIALDFRHDVIYACHMSQILSIKYTGETAVFVKHGKTLLVAMALDIPGNMLYYHVQKEIRGISLAGGDGTIVALLSSLPFGMLYVNNVLYVTPMSGGRSITILNITEGSEKTLPTVYTSGLLLCTLPR